ncbi:uncharacterized protein [Dysidea avara]|uniref:uncharacterized protein isoform X2 n=1 Tax=Dysidea avara TaxID=196820 RepID=UPI00331ED367
MATDIEPNLSKPPPHLEGYLLKQNPRSRLGRRGWKSYFFFVRKDKLLYFLKKEDAHGGQKPILSIPLPSVISVTECEFDGVPKKHHINCGLSVASHNITLNLLAETPEDSRRWVRDLCYIKAYWSKMEVRTTVLSVEQERELLKIALEEEKNTVGLLEGEYSLHEDRQRRDSSAQRMSSQQVSIHMACEAKQSVNVMYTDTVVEVLDKLRDKLNSSGSNVWAVDNHGNDILLDMTDQLLSYNPSTHKFFVLEPNFWVVVTFFSDGKFEVIPALTTITANEIVEAQEIMFHRDLRGMGNPGVFLKNTDSQDVLFGSNECPFKVLFDVDSSGALRRLPVGHLLVKNKALGAGKRYRTTRFVPGPITPIEDKQLQIDKAIAEEEIVQRAALDLLVRKKAVGNSKGIEQIAADYDIIVGSSGSSDSSPALSRKHAVRRSPHNKRKMNVQEAKEKREEREPLFTDSSGEHNSGEYNTALVNVRQRGGSYSIETRRDATSSLGREYRTKSVVSPTRSSFTDSTVSELETTVELVKEDDNKSDHRSSKEKLVLESSAKVSPIVMRKAMDMKRCRDRPGPLFDDDEPTHYKSKQSILSGTAAAAAAAAAASKSLTEQSRQGSREDLLSRPRADSATTADKRKSVDYIPGSKFTNTKINYNDEEARLVALFDQPPSETEPPPVSTMDSLANTLAEKSQTYNYTTEQAVKPTLTPMSLDFSNLQAIPIASPTSPGGSTGTPETYDVKTPAMLKLVQRQITEMPHSNRFKTISLSGVILVSSDNGWCIAEGNNFHDSVNVDTGDHCEIFTLSEHVKAIYHHGNKRWYVQPQNRTSETSASTVEPVNNENEGGLPVTAGVTVTVDFESRRKVLVQNLNKAVQDILQHFGTVRQEAEKAKLGDEAVNPVVGQLMRCNTCPAILSVLLDGKKPYRFEGIVIDSLWDVIVALCKAGSSTRIHTVPHAQNTFSMAQQVVNEVIKEQLLREDEEKCQWFIITSIRAQLLTSWLECIPHLTETIKKYYLPGAFLMEANASAEKLYKDVILIADPLQHLPFKLYLQQPALVVERSPTPPVVMKTHAATGQKSEPITGESEVTAVTSHPIDQPDSSVSRPRGAEQALKNIQEGRVPSPQPPVLSQPARSTGKGWLKKITEGLQSLDKGGAITGRSTVRQQQPQQQQQQQQQRVDSPIPHTDSTTTTTSGGSTSLGKRILNSLNVGGAITGPPVSQSSNRKVVALYSNTGEDADELSFNKGDVLTVVTRLNDEWFKCRRGNEIGIVPANYIQPFTE